MTLLLAHCPLGVSSFHTVALFEALVELCVSVKSVVQFPFSWLWIVENVKFQMFAVFC